MKADLRNRTATQIAEDIFGGRSVACQGQSRLADGINIKSSCFQIDFKGGGCRAAFQISFKLESGLSHGQVINGECNHLFVSPQRPTQRELFHGTLMTVLVKRQVRNRALQLCL